MNFNDSKQLMALFRRWVDRTRSRTAWRESGTTIHGFGVGPKEVGGELRPQTSLRVHLSRKLPRSELPPEITIPDEFAGIPTDVVERAAPDFCGSPCSPSGSCSDQRKCQLRPVVPGISLAHCDVPMGTLGCFCRRQTEAETGPVLILANNHTLANMNQGRPNDPIHQPAWSDNHTGPQIAKLVEFVPLRSGCANLMDAAIAELDSNVPFSTEICGIGAIQSAGSPTCRLPVSKHGRTTGRTDGIITDWPWEGCVRGYPFAEQFMISPQDERPFADTGDSGALIVSNENQAIGLLFAKEGCNGIAAPIEPILCKFGIRLL